MMFIWVSVFITSKVRKISPSLKQTNRKNIDFYFLVVSNGFFLTMGLYYLGEGSFSPFSVNPSLNEIDLLT